MVQAAYQKTRPTTLCSRIIRTLNLHLKRRCLVNQKRKFKLEFKQKGVALVLEQNYSIARAATSMGISAKTLHSWLAIAREHHESGLSEDEQAELHRLRNESRGLRIKKEILKKASAFFTKHML